MQRQANEQKRVYRIRKQFDAFQQRLPSSYHSNIVSMLFPGQFVATLPTQACLLKMTEAEKKKKNGQSWRIIGAIKGGMILGKGGLGALRE